MPRYSYGTRRRDQLTSTITSGVQPEPVAEPEPAAAEPAVVETPETSYRDLQAQAKEAGIPANQSRDELEAALAEGRTDGRD